MKITTTACCALAQINDVNNETTKEELQELIDKLILEKKETYIPGDESGKGQTTFFVITTPTEQKLENTLKNLFFERGFKFNRRTGYPEGLLNFWFLRL